MSAGPHGLVGLRDAVMGDWYKIASGEVYPGFAIRSADVVLDMGCGEGWTSHFCARRGAEVIFADLDGAAVAAAERRLAGTPARALTSIVSDADPLPLPDGVATKVIALEVLDRVDDPDRLLRELARVGSSGAHYLLAMPEPVRERFERDGGPDASSAEPDLESGRQAFEIMVRSAGLTIEHHDSSSFYWTLWFASYWGNEVDPTAAASASPLSALLGGPDGGSIKGVLDSFMPRHQIILARKP
jgi:SAM-dependent methyltransferase